VLCNDPYKGPFGKEFAVTEAEYEYPSVRVTNLEPDCLQIGVLPLMPDKHSHTQGFGDYEGGDVRIGPEDRMKIRCRHWRKNFEVFGYLAIARDMRERDTRAVLLTCMQGLTYPEYGNCGRTIQTA